MTLEMGTEIITHESCPESGHDVNWQAAVTDWSRCG